MISVLLVLVSAALLRLAWRCYRLALDGADRWRALRAPAAACASLAAGDRGAARLTGTVEPGGAGTLESPVTGTPCVWWRVETDRGLTGPEGGPQIREWDVESSAEPFVLWDGTGGIRVAPGTARITGVETTARVLVPDGGRPGHRVERRESVLREGAELSVRIPRRTAAGCVALGVGGVTAAIPGLAPATGPLLWGAVLHALLALLCLGTAAFVSHDLLTSP